jgi:hypothetical protein
VYGFSLTPVGRAAMRHEPLGPEREASARGVSPMGSSSSRRFYEVSFVRRCRSSWKPDPLPGEATKSPKAGGREARGEEHPAAGVRALDDAPTAPNRLLAIEERRC